MVDKLFELHYKLAHRMVDKLFELYYKLAHRNEEIEQTIHELQTVLKFRTNENKSLYKEIDRLRKVIEIKDAENLRLAEENNQLKLRNKMLTKIGFNSIYGLNCGKNHWVYTDTDSIKSESEEV